MSLDWGLILGVVGVLGIPVGAGIGIAVADPFTKGELQFVRGCFAAAAIITLLSFLLLTYEIPVGLGKTIGAGVVGALTLMGLVIALDWTKQRFESSKSDATSQQKRSALDGTIKFECLQEAFRLPADGKLLELIASDDTARTVGLQSHWVSEHAYNSNPGIIPTRHGWIDKCRITNFGTSPVFNVSINVEAIFSEHIPIAEKTVEQKEIDRKTIRFSVDQVDAGQGNSVDILIWNTTRFLTHLSFANDVKLQRLGSVERENVKLIPAQRMVALFPPKT
ncbi:hypothetical protein [Bradyrhizobium sp. NBAIM01]|uniref:hypothetical protein n=1 Tax=Bradyrhizobium sp. NBAIM01 TaxID=2793818 RepID=UPI001CD73051|nr:hypothetical protein [Bradyrhizobium sp. NBAIM01]MCA1516355.1 hypothetical protein [Bradyrhizobium sp. NBAIM01]